MIFKCFYEGKTPLDNSICNDCSLFIETCAPIAAADGYALGSECCFYFCEGCSKDCIYQSK